VLSTMPVKIIFDTASVCNLRCPLCSTGAGILKQKQGLMRHDMFARIYNQVADEVMCVSLFNWGEPFLNPEVFKIIEETHERGAISHVHSNFSLKKADAVEKIAESNLSSLVLSIDGAEDSTYRIYRKGGEFDLVMRNITRLVEKRRKLGKRFPEIIWKFIVHKHNEHEIGKAKQMAAAIGVDKIQFTPIWADLQPGVADSVRQDQWAEEWLPVDRTEFRFDSRQSPLFEKACPFLWQDPVINVDGTVSPCCFLNNSKYNFGDLKKNSFEEIWNNDLYRYSRSLFSEEEYVGPKISSVCDSCTLYKQVKQKPHAETNKSSAVAVKVVRLASKKEPSAPREA
jgi:radical SAM protein with 4Fe4S-binding SPASM domain